MITLFEARVVLDAEVVTKLYDPAIELRAGCGADLMSDVLSFAHIEGMILFTGLTNQQVVRTAEMAGVSVVLFVRGKVPPPETVALAEQRGIVLLRSGCSMFEACGRLYRLGLQSVDVRGEDRKKMDQELSKLCHANP